MLPTFRTPYAYDLSSTNTPATTDTTLGLPIGIGRRLPPVYTARKSSTTLASTPNPITSSTTPTTTPLVTYTKTSTATTTSESQAIQSIELKGTLNLTLGNDSDALNAQNISNATKSSTASTTTGPWESTNISTTVSTTSGQKIHGMANVTQTSKTTTTGTSSATPTITATTTGTTSATKTTTTRLDFTSTDNKTLVTTLNTTLDPTGSPQTTTSTTTTTSVTGGAATNQTTNATIFINNLSKTVTLTTTTGTTSTTTLFSTVVDPSTSTSTTTTFRNGTATLTVSKAPNGSTVLVHQDKGANNVSSTTYFLQDTTTTSTSLLPPSSSSTATSTHTVTGTTTTATGSIQTTISHSQNKSATTSSSSTTSSPFISGPPTSTDLLTYTLTTTTPTTLLNVTGDKNANPLANKSAWYDGLVGTLNLTLGNDSDALNAQNISNATKSSTASTTTGPWESTNISTTVSTTSGQKIHGMANVTQTSKTTTTGTSSATPTITATTTGTTSATKTTTTRLDFTSTDNKTLVTTLNTTLDPTGSPQTTTSTTTTTSVTGGAATNQTTNATIFINNLSKTVTLTTTTGTTSTTTLFSTVVDPSTSTSTTTTFRNGTATLTVSKAPNGSTVLVHQDKGANNVSSTTYFLQDTTTTSTSLLPPSSSSTATSTHTVTGTTTTATGSIQTTISHSQNKSATTSSSSTTSSPFISGPPTSTDLLTYTLTTTTPTTLLNVTGDKNANPLANKSAWYATQTDVPTTLQAVSGQTFHGKSNLFNVNGTNTTILEFISNATSVTNVTTKPASTGGSTTTTTTTSVLSGHGTTSTTTATISITNSTTTGKPVAATVTTTTPNTGTVTATISSIGSATSTSSTSTYFSTVDPSRSTSTTTTFVNGATTLTVTNANNGSTVFVYQKADKNASSTTFVHDEPPTTTSTTLLLPTSSSTTVPATTTKNFTVAGRTTTANDGLVQTTISTTTNNTPTIVLNAIANSYFSTSTTTSPFVDGISDENVISVNTASQGLDNNPHAESLNPTFIIIPIFSLAGLAVGIIGIFYARHSLKAHFLNRLLTLATKYDNPELTAITQTDMDILKTMDRDRWLFGGGANSALQTVQNIVERNSARLEAGELRIDQDVPEERHGLPIGMRRLNGDAVIVSSHTDSRITLILDLLEQVQKITSHSSYKTYLLELIGHALADIASDKNLNAESQKLITQYIAPAYTAEFDAHIMWHLENKGAVAMVGSTTNLNIDKLNNNKYTFDLNFHEAGTNYLPGEGLPYRLHFGDREKPMFKAPLGSETRSVHLNDAHFQYNSSSSNGKQFVTLTGNGGTTFNIATGQGDDTFVIPYQIFTDDKSVVNILGGSGRDTFIIQVKDGWNTLPGNIHIWDFDPTKDTVVFQTLGSYATPRIYETKRTLFNSPFVEYYQYGDGTILLAQGSSNINGFGLWLNDVGFSGFFRDNSLYKAAQHEFKGDGVTNLKLDVNIGNANNANRIFENPDAFKSEIVNDIAGDTRTGAMLLVDTALNTQFSQLETSNDHDYFRVYLQKGRSYMFLMEHRPNIAGDGVLSTSLKLKDTKGNDINPSNWGNWGNTRIDFFAYEDGYYFLDASGDPAQYTGEYAGTQTTSKYSISAMEITHQAINPISVTKSSFTAPINHVGYKMNLSAGDYMQIDFDTLGKDIGLNMSIHNADHDVLDFTINQITKKTHTFLANKSGDYFIDALAAIADTNANFVLSSVKKEVEGNRSTMAALEENNLIFNKLDTKADHDWYRVSLLAGKNYQFDMKKTTAGYGGLDTFLNLRDLNGKVLASHDDISMQNRDSRLVYFNTLKGDYFIDASSWSEKSSGDYSLSYKVI